MDLLKGWVPHLEDLRGMVLRVVLVWVVAAVALFTWKDEVLTLLRMPLDVARPHVILLTTGVTEQFAVYMKISLWGGLLVVLPYVLWELWRFIHPALYQAERRWVGGLMLVAPLMGCLGLVFGWFVLLPPMLGFFLGFEAEGVEAMPRLGDYIGLLLSTLVAMAVAFNLPLVLIGLVQVGVLDVVSLRKARRVVILGAFVAAAIITPTPDPFTMTLLAIPLWLLFEVALMVATWLRSDH